jgi:hypothetical protein
VKLSLAAWVLLAVGLAVWYASFVKDAGIIKAHGYAGVTYSWTLFACGTACCAAGFLLSLLGARLSKDQTAVEKSPASGF